MSYILEALKKAQAERQLGSAPTIHAPAAHAVPVQSAQRKPLVLGIAAGALVASVAAVVAWKQAGPAASAPKAQAPQLPAQLPTTPAAPPVTQHVEVQPGPGQVVALVGVPDSPPKAPPAFEPDPAPKAAPHKAVAAPAALVAARTVPAPVAPLPEPVQPAVARASAALPAAEDSLPLLNALPEAVRSQLPRVAFGGYIYSPNPADRLLLIDKILRREGEEVAPGLVLEKLMPKAAVMNFRGVRYRVPY